MIDREKLLRLLEKEKVAYTMEEHAPVFTMEEMRHLTKQGAVLEHCWRNCLPQLKSFDPHLYVEAVKKLGAENTIMSTDFAQISDPSSAEGLRTFIAVMYQFGCTPEEITLMVKNNPYRLLSICN